MLLEIDWYICTSILGDRMGIMIIVAELTKLNTLSFLPLPMPDLLFVTTAILDILSGAVALLVSYTAFKYNRLIESDVLKFVSFGFMMLGIGLLLEGSLLSLLAFNVGRIAEDLRLVYISSLLYLVLQVFAYSSFALGYSRGAYSRREGITTAVFALFLIARPVRQYYFLLGTYVNDITQLIVIVLLSFVVFQGFLMHGRTKSKFSLLVLAGFVLILIAHLVMLGSSIVMSGFIFVLANFVQFAGFLSLLLFLIRSGHIDTATEDEK
ncbi:MAG: hypothetical protein QXQ39_03440 [Conexivisphaerales archaeon]